MKISTIISCDLSGARNTKFSWVYLFCGSSTVKTCDCYSDKVQAKLTRVVMTESFAFHEAIKAWTRFPHHCPLKRTHEPFDPPPPPPPQRANTTKCEWWFQTTWHSYDVTVMIQQFTCCRPSRLMFGKFRGNVVTNQESNKCYGNLGEVARVCVIKISDS